ncbi:1-deoxy-D-xylulose 5-phosphate synthase; flavoprotein, thiamin-binding [Cupriavidus taiwanensis]|uniref:1-deoxy-D-xylulose-5-phosphate synthase n=1 Tax=Cupriavidus taiwanensis TaxID=164546 RepID=A0A976G1M8_9BURK|nr:1-deoxy-D-xylulose-5-phosphate synthase [Cupriavidus taiwanensis]SOZ54744.1 1-deoxy-D-xylulose 5-phosphate synthase; flavoprotein, thiamin-binding [Cupriavidus taiwanensis]SOZ55725.1 1-deoxy-D-xylulose 5-phosphate synthase; flavoprotein, thiamin-binding [Cupriavidus taiwanensis]SOZ58083.1 1-deoxy-D-xylulose 5-phosphate synthase; flavoprotein, thiamin-binding [Cupriavidus taiwanensis]SPA05203.1 1-deoxy-D-xylulose 5-phosphate synthase; flavoprotein, thiamin-binding [Cupriavidus taiwanensis]
MTYALLNKIDAPADLRKLDRRELQTLADELRAYVLESVSQTGGHLSSNLGTVELTIALHYVFNTPDDRLVWDVGHQSYPHKILTGRRERMRTLRQWGGISGFPRRSESEYDTFGTAHSSTSISAALGMALGARTLGEKRVSVAVIGDGAMTAGMAFEALNNAGVYKDLPLVVVLNDNDMSISPPVGALNRHLARLLSGQFYAATKKGIEKVLSVAPPVLEFAKRFEEHAKGMMVPATLFEEFGFNYIGPIDGHDLNSLVPTLQNIRERALEGGGPQFLHVVTKKGQGYKLAEADPILYHGPGKFNPAEGIRPAAKPARKTYTQVFGDWLCDMAAADKRLVGITPAMREGSGMVEFEKRFPDRYYDVGIAEQHAVTFAGGLACEGLKPVVAIYSTFLQRGYDQLIHDVALQNLPVVFALDRAGLVGADGATHAGAYDIAYLRCIPNMMVMTPSDENECRQLLTTAFQQDCPSAVRYPRGSGPGAAIAADLAPVPVGKGVVRRDAGARAGHRVGLLAFGSMVQPALGAAEALDATVADMRFVKPLDVALVKRLAADHDYLVTVEEGSVMGGAGSAVLEALAEAGIDKPVLTLGLPDRFVDHGDPAYLLQQCGLDAAGIERSVRERFGLDQPQVTVASRVA